MNYFPFHIGDYASATRHLSWEEDGAFRRLLDVYYTTEKALPLDLRAVCRLVLAQTESQREAVAVVLGEFFESAPDGWHNKRADVELTAMAAKQEQQSTKDAHEAERMARYREKRAMMFAALRLAGVVPAWDVAMKELQRLFDETCNAPATRTGALPETGPSRLSIPTPTPTPTPTPEEKRQEQEPPNPRKRGKGFDAAAIDLPEWLDRGLWQRWCKDRADRKKPITEEGARAQVAQLDKHRESGREPQAVLEHAMASGHQGLYPPAANSGARGPPPAISQAEKIAEASRLLGFAPMTIKVPEEVDA